LEGGSEIRENLKTDKISEEDNDSFTSAKEEVRGSSPRKGWRSLLSSLRRAETKEEMAEDIPMSGAPNINPVAGPSNAGLVLGPTNQKYTSSTPLLSSLCLDIRLVPDQLLDNYSKMVSDLTKKGSLSREEKLFISDAVETITKVSSARHQIYLRSMDTHQRQVGIGNSGDNQMQSSNPSVMDGRTTIRLNELVLRPEVFDGTRPRPRRWLEDYGEAIVANGWSDYISVKYFPTFLRGAAKDWYITDVRPHLDTQTRWAVVHNLFVDNYLGESDYNQLSQAVDNAKQRPGELVSTFIPRVRRLMLMLTPDLPEKEQIRQIKTKLRPEYKALLAYSAPRNMAELRGACLKIEAGFSDRLRGEASNASIGYVTRGSRTPKAEVSERRPTSRDGNYFKPANQETKSGPNKQIRVDRKAANSSTRASKAVICFKCDRSGHFARDCFASTKKDGTRLPNNEARKVNAVMNNAESSNDNKEDIQEINHVKIWQKDLINMVGSLRDEKLITLDILCENRPIKAVVDTGAYATLINGRVARECGISIKPQRLNLVGADGGKLDVAGTSYVNLEISIGKTCKSKMERVIVVNNLTCPMLVGVDFLRAMDICINVSKAELSFARRKPLNGVRINKEQELPPRSVSLIRAQANVAGTVMAVPFNFLPDVTTANSLAEVKDNSIPILVINLGREARVLKTGLQVAGIECIKEHSNGEVQAVNRITNLGGTNEAIRIGDQLDPSQARELLSLLSKHLNAFSIEGSLGSAKGYKHEIQLLPNATPFAEPLRRRALVQIEETRNQVSKLLKEGIIEESESPWASAYVLARKKNGEMRLCVDFRKLNDMTKKFVYPLPNVDDCIETLSGKRYFSLIDFASGFWQIEMEEKSKELTAFRTEDGLFQFKRMPFGLTNAPASFQRLINLTLAGLKGLNLQIFIDDVCVGTKTWSEHLAMLSKLLELVEKANLKIKSSKCIFAAEKVTFLGHEISAEGIRQEQSKLSALTRLPAPRDVKEMRRVLGMLSYYRKFVPNFALIAEPLTRMTRKTTEFKWGTEQDSAFRQLITALKQNATLAHFNHEDPIMLKTDASRQGVAGILLQRQNDDWKMVSCCSRRLSPSESNYGITDLEGLAIMYSVSKFRHYLLGKRFQILVDHCALCVLSKKAPNSARLKRWAIALSEFDMEIVYTKGNQHQDVDCLSRAPVDNETDEYLENKVYLVTPIDIPEWISAYKDIEAKELFQKAYDKLDDWKLINDVIYKNDKLYVPTEKRDELIRVTHMSNMNAHPGVQATRAKLAENYYWPNMVDDVMRIIKICPTCLAHKPERRKPAGQMESFEILEAGKQVGIDCLGPLKETINGNVHIIVAIDMFTRYVDAKAVPDITAPSFTQYLSEYCGRYGIPHTILTDQSTTFCNEFVKEVMKAFGAHHLKSTPYHSQGNAITERVIQTLQEKLRLVLDDPLQDSNWDVALPIAILAINTSYHKSIGYTPYELTFGRRPPIQDNFIANQVSVHDMYARLIKNYMHECQSNAIAIQSISQQQSRERYNEQHRKVVYQEGDQAMIKLPPRSSKLAPKYHGPFTVIDVKKDIYKLENNESKKVQTRHVSDLKLFKACVNLLTVLCFIMAVAGQVTFEKVKPLIWLTTDYEVELGSAEYDIEFAWTPPCMLLEKALNTEAMNETYQRLVQENMPNFYLDCFNLYVKEFKERMDNFKITEPHLRRFPTGQNTRIERDSQEEELIKSRPSNDSAEPNYIELSNTLSNLAVSSEYLDRRKRGVLGQIAKDLAIQGLGMIAGNVVSNLISSVFERLNPNSVYNRQIKLEQSLENLKYNFDIMKEVSRGTLDQIQVLTETMRRRIAALEYHAKVFPQYTWVATVIANRIFQSGLDAQRIIDEANNGRVATYEMARLFQMPLLKNIKPEHTQFLSATRTKGKESIRLKFMTKVISPDTFVYRVAAFNHWDNLATVPEYLEYRGATLLIYNETANCIKAVDPPHSKTIAEECAELDGEDSMLSRWETTKKTFELNSTADRSSVEKIFSYNYIYCFPGNITIGKDTYRCPMEAFRLKTDRYFKTADRRHVPSKVQLNATLRHDAIDVVHAGHFEDDSDTVNELRIFDKLNEFRLKLDSIHAENVVLSKSSIGWTIGGIVIAGLVAGLIYCCVVYKLLACFNGCCGPRDSQETYSMRSLRDMVSFYSAANPYAPPPGTSPPAYADNAVFNPYLTASARSN